MSDDPRSDRMERLWALAHEQLAALIDATATARMQGKVMQRLGRGRRDSDCGDQKCQRCLRCYAISMQRLGRAKNDLEDTSERLVRIIIEVEEEAEQIRGTRSPEEQA